ncbi:MAG: type II toxin-antitoxin system RelE/ParE family toxin [Casimicrobiaceae bacterium]
MNRRHANFERRRAGGRIACFGSTEVVTGHVRYYDVPSNGPRIGIFRQALRGGRKGQHSIRINDQWRICFRWNDGDAHDVEIVDYH